MGRVVRGERGGEKREEPCGGRGRQRLQRKREKEAGQKERVTDSYPSQCIIITNKEKQQSYKHAEAYQYIVQSNIGLQ